MAKLKKSQPDKMKLIIKREEEKIPPPPLGEPAGSTDWMKHTQEGHLIKTFSKIVDDGRGNKQVIMNKPNPGMVFIPIKEDLAGYPFRWIWIYCIEEKTGRIIFKENSGHVDFVDWDVPKKKEDETKD